MVWRKKDMRGKKEESERKRKKLKERERGNILREVETKEIERGRR